MGASQVRTRNESRTDVSRPRTPGLLYAVLSAVLCVLVGTLALTSRQTPPPTIAEFAPQAVEQITDPSGDRAGAGGDVTDENAPLEEGTGADGAATRAAVDVARARRCVGDPPRQIEDPQSPPCVPYWSGDNGGATSRGVTRDEIRVTDPGYSRHWSPALAAFFNRRFEFYGRRIRLIARTVPFDDPPARAAAQAAYDQDHAFASTGPVNSGHAYFDQLARLGIVGVHFYAMFPETYLAAHRPYLWTYAMANDRLFATMGNWYCSRFAGRNAVHAGDPLLQASRRKPGIILTDEDWASAEPMNEQLASCGGRSNTVIRAKTANNYDQVLYENAVLQMKTSGVTTVACLCDHFALGFAMRAATNQGYFPEWLATSYGYNAGSSLQIRLYGAREQMESMMLLLARPMERPYFDHPPNWAFQETSSTSEPPGENSEYELDLYYRALLLLASGLQMAGPHLTPASFERGLHQAVFANPLHRIMAGAVGFDDGDHSMTDDAAEVWWSNTEANPSHHMYGRLGSYCYVAHGARRRIGTFPTDDPFFKGECDNGTS